MSVSLEKGEWVKGVAHWREGATAFISVAFTWRLPEARRLAEYYRAIGVTHIRVGGPGTFTQKKYTAEFACRGSNRPSTAKPNFVGRSHRDMDWNQPENPPDALALAIAVP